MVRKAFFFLFLLSSTMLAQEVRLTAKAEADTFRLGSWIDVQVKGDVNATVDTIAPALKDSIGLLEVVKVERSGAEPKWLIRLTTIDSGKIFLPPIEFDYNV